MSCEHQHFECRVEVIRLVEHDVDADPHAFTTDITIWCADCQERFCFDGVEMGSHPAKPMVSFGGFELRAPIVSETTMRLRTGLPL